MRSSRVAHIVAVVLLVSGVACSGDAGDSEEADDTATTGSTVEGGGPAAFDLVAEGRHECEDERGDPTTSAEAQVEPPVPQQGVDIVRAGVEIDDEALTGIFELAGPVDGEAEPELVVFVGLTSDPDAFELRVTEVEQDVWGVELQRARSADGGADALPTASARVEGATVTFVVPQDVLPVIAPNQPVNYGTTGILVDESGTRIDRQGTPLGDEAEPVRVLDDCLFA